MALEISEFAARASDGYGRVDLLQRPANVVQPGVPIVAAPATPAAGQSAMFSANTTMVRLVLTADARLRFYTPSGGADATAATVNDEFFPAGTYIEGVTPGQKIAVIAGVSA